MKVPFIDFKREWSKFEKVFLTAFKEFGRGGWYVLGPEVDKFEKEYAQFCGYKYAIAVSTGLSALEVALRAAGVGRGDEVITVANSAVASSLAITAVGAKPVFCDIGDDFLINPAKIESLITSRTKAILPVHLFGKICDMGTINSLAQKHGLKVVEDACQAHGAGFAGAARINTKAFSFYPTKNLGALGEGGAIVTNDLAVRDFALMYRNYGQIKRYDHEIIGNNYRLDPLKCKLLGIKLKQLKSFVKTRQDIAKQYVTKLSRTKLIRINKFDPKCSYHVFVVRVLGGKRNELQKSLKDLGIETLVHYPTSINKQKCYQKDYVGLKLENTDKFQEEILSLPCYPFLSKKELNYTIKAVLDCAEKISNQ